MPPCAFLMGGRAGFLLGGGRGWWYGEEDVCVMLLCVYSVRCVVLVSACTAHPSATVQAGPSHNSGPLCPGCRYCRGL